MMNKFVIVFLSSIVIADAASVAVSVSVSSVNDWNSYKSKYSKKYKSPAEDKSRMEIFLQNKDKIDKHNKLYDEGLASYTMSLNEYSDLQNHEFRTRMGQYKHHYDSNMNKSYDESLFVLGMSNIVIPKFVDWRKKGAVTKVKKQGHCGSCWTFSTTGALEGQFFRKTGRLVSMSEQNLVDCVYPDLSNTEKCGGGSRHRAFNYIKENGIDTEKFYPYKARGGSCKFNKKNSVTKIQAYRNIPEGDELRLQQAVANIGPIAIAVDASEESFQHYSGGIYYEKNCRTSSQDLSHDMLLVGYGTDKRGKEYYLIKNSYGDNWGERGFMRMARNRKNHCGIATVATYPVL